MTGARATDGAPIYRVAWVTHAATHPPRRGNQIRTASLISNLGPDCRVDSISLTIQRTDLPLPRHRRAITPRWTDWRCRDPLMAAWTAALASTGYPQVFSQHLARLTPHPTVRRLLAQADVVVVAPPYHLEWVRRLSRPGTPLVLDEHSIEADMYPPGLARWTRVVAREVARAERVAVSLAELVLVTSDSDADACRRMGARRVAVAPNGVDVKAFVPASPRQREALRSEFDLPDGPLGVFVGSGHPPNVRAVAALEAQAAEFVSAGVTVMAVGRSSAGRAPVPGILHVGEVVNVVPYLQAADVALCPLVDGSGTSLKTLEYLAAGLPLVSTEVGVRGLGIRAGVEAEVCDLASFASRCSGLVRDPERARLMGEAGRRLVEAQFSWQASAATVEGALRELVDQRRRRRPTVLYVSASAALYGSDLALERSAAALTAAGGRAVVAVAEPGPLVDRLRMDGARVEVVRLGVLRRRLLSASGAARTAACLLTSRYWLARLGHEERIDLVHSNSSSVLSGALAARALGVPHVWHLREHLASGPTGRLLGSAMTRGADVVIAVSEATRATLPQKGQGGRARILVLRDGVDIERFSCLPSRSEAAAHLGIDPARLVVAMIARINRWKGQEVLLDAVALLRRRGRDVQLLLAGDTYTGDEPIRDALVAQARRLALADDLVLPGFADPADVLAVADIVVAPSTRPEPYGLAVVDALTAGRVVVASDSGGHRETVRHLVDGMLVPPGDPVALANALDRLIGAPTLRASLAAAARRDRARFDGVTTSDQLLALYEVLVHHPCDAPD